MKFEKALEKMREGQPVGILEEHPVLHTKLCKVFYEIQNGKIQCIHWDYGKYVFSANHEFHFSEIESEDWVIFNPVEHSWKDVKVSNCVWCNGTGYLFTGIMCRICHGQGEV